MSSPARKISATSRARLLLVVAVAMIALAVWGVSQIQRNSSERSFTQTRADEQMLTAMLDQETGLRGFALTRREDFLAPYTRGIGAFDRAARTARTRASDTEQRNLVSRELAAARRWQRLARDEIAVLRRSRIRTIDLSRSLARKRVFDGFRAANARYRANVAQARERQVSRAGLVSVGVILLISVVFGGVGYVMIERDTRRHRARRERDRDYRRTQTEFGESMQIMRDEREAHALVKRHLEGAIPGAVVTVLNRNNSDNRLVAATPTDAEGPLRERLGAATPESCLSIRLGRAYAEGDGADPLLSCAICGKTAAQVSCVPSLVSGEVIGSVLVQSGRVLGPREQDRVTESIAQAAPVLANLRTIAIAETRAATDALTGLPNARACHDNLKRMVAHAGRNLSPVSALMLDLDHFKQVNDRFGHGAGDDALAATGSALRSIPRASDFAGRCGGEEFLILLPDTAHEGALALAEKLRQAIEEIEIPAIDSQVTASIGVASYPLDALDGDALLRKADRALYAAKAAGRNRVELAMPADPVAATAK